jgi:hypothetical protein
VIKGEGGPNCNMGAYAGVCTPVCGYLVSATIDTVVQHIAVIVLQKTLFI